MSRHYHHRPPFEEIGRETAEQVERWAALRERLWGEFVEDLPDDDRSFLFGDVHPSPVVFRRIGPPVPPPPTVAPELLALVRQAAAEMAPGELGGHVEDFGYGHTGWVPDELVASKVATPTTPPSDLWRDVIAAYHRMASTSLVDGPRSPTDRTTT